MVVAGKSKRERSAAYSAALTEGRANYPGDEIAANRLATLVVRRALRVSAAGEDQQKIIAQALLDCYDKNADRDGRGPLSVVKTFPDYVIASAADGKLYFIRYSVGDAGIIFQAPQDTEGTHVPVAS
jgi:hypothetical protein